MKVIAIIVLTFTVDFTGSTLSSYIDSKPCSNFKMVRRPFVVITLVHFMMGFSFKYIDFKVTVDLLRYEDNFKVGTNWERFNYY